MRDGDWERVVLWKERGTLHHLTPSQLTLATQVTRTPSKYYFCTENIHRLQSGWLIYENADTFWSKPEVFFVHYVTYRMANDRMMSLTWTCECLTWRLTTNKHGGPADGILPSAIYKPFITLVCPLSRLISNHWWQYLLLIVNLNEMQEKTYLKVVLLGKVNSGKTCLVTRYITRSFSEETPSVSRSFSSQFLFIFYSFFRLRLQNE